jgi:hypothetical protein
MKLETLIARLWSAAMPLAAAGCSVFVQTGPARTEADFAAIQPEMTREQVLGRVGPPTWTFGVRQENLTIWNYRYSHSACLIYQVSMRPDGTVRDVGQAPDPACDRKL